MKSSIFFVEEKILAHVTYSFVCSIDKTFPRLELLPFDELMGRGIQIQWLFIHGQKSIPTPSHPAPIGIPFILNITGGSRKISHTYKQKIQIPLGFHI